MQYLNLGLLGVGAADSLNGLSLSRLITMADGNKSVVSGVAIFGISIGTHKAINGLALGGMTVFTDGDINGVTSSFAYIYTEKIRGLAFTVGYLETEIYKGVAIAGYAKTNQMNGLSITLFNWTKELHGVQFGLINYAKNNPKGLGVLPFINLHFGKNKKYDY